MMRRSSKRFGAVGYHAPTTSRMKSFVCSLIFLFCFLTITLSAKNRGEWPTRLGRPILFSVVRSHGESASLKGIIKDKYFRNKAANENDLENRKSIGHTVEGLSVQTRFTHLIVELAFLRNEWQTRIILYNRHMVRPHARRQRADRWRTQVVGYKLNLPEKNPQLWRTAV